MEKRKSVSGWHLVDVDEGEFGLGLVDREHVQLLVLLDGLVDRVRLEALAHAPEKKTITQNFQLERWKSKHDRG